VTLSKTLTTFVVVSTATFLAGCYAEFDLGRRTQRTDPCTGRVEYAYVYVNPVCRTRGPQPVFQSRF
jgi:hypothetical protein